MTASSHMLSILPRWFYCLVSGELELAVHPMVSASQVVAQPETAWLDTSHHQ